MRSVSWQIVQKKEAANLPLRKVVDQTVDQRAHQDQTAKLNGVAVLKNGEFLHRGLSKKDVFYI